LNFSNCLGSPTIGDVIQQQFPQETVALLSEMAKDYSKKRRTIVLSNATQGMKNDLMDMLGLQRRKVSLGQTSLHFGSALDLNGFTARRILRKTGRGTRVVLDRCCRFRRPTNWQMCNQTGGCFQLNFIPQ